MLDDAQLKEIDRTTSLRPNKKKSDKMLDDE